MTFIKRIKGIKNNLGAMRYLKNTSWLFGEKILRMSIGLFVSIWVTRYLGPEQFGMLSYAQSFVAFFSFFATLGLDNIVIKELVNTSDTRRKNRIIGTAFYLKLLGAFISIALLSIAVYFELNSVDTSVYLFIIISATVFQSFNVIDFYFQSEILSKYVVYSNVITLVISSVIKIYLIMQGATLEAFVYVVLFDSFVLAAGLIYFYTTQKLNMFEWCFHINEAVALLKKSWLLIFSGLVVVIYMKIDQVMLQNMLGSFAVGEYSAAARLSEICYFIPVIISSSLFPAVINAKNISKELYLKRMQQLYDFLVWVAILIAIPMSFVSQQVITLLYGDAFKGAGDVLMIHIWSAVFVFLGVASSKWFIVEGLQRYSFYRTFTGAFINIILNLILIPKFGIYGAAIATLLSQFIASYLFNLFFKSSRITFKLQTNSFLLPFRRVGLKFE